MSFNIMPVVSYILQGVVKKEFWGHHLSFPLFETIGIVIGRPLTLVSIHSL